MNTTVRTLPIRVTPIDGEAIDSWLEAIADRTHTTFGDLLAAVGLSPYNGMGTTAWIVRLNPDEVATISAATGIAPDVLEAMTLQHYSGRAVRIKPDARMLSRAFPWGRGRGSRFCPACLDITGFWTLAAAMALGLDIRLHQPQLLARRRLSTLRRGPAPPRTHR